MTPLCLKKVLEATAKAVHKKVQFKHKIERQPRFMNHKMKSIKKTHRMTRKQVSSKRRRKNKEKGRKKLLHLKKNN